VPEEFEVKRGKWSFAHLPVIPPHFALKPIEKSPDRLKLLTRLIKRKDVDGLINACDAGREGELIFNYIAQHAKTRKPVRRLWLQSMTPAARSATASPAARRQRNAKACARRRRLPRRERLADRHQRHPRDDRVQFQDRRLPPDHGRSRADADAGHRRRARATRSASSSRATTGKLEADFRRQGRQLHRRWFDEASRASGDEHATAEFRLWDVRSAPRRSAPSAGKPGIVSEEAKPSTQLSPLLFDLTSLQREANGRFGFSAKTTLRSRRHCTSAQGADLPANRFARAAGRLHRHRQGRCACCTGEGAGKGHDEVPLELRAVRQRDPQAQLGDAEQAHLQQREGERSLRDHPDGRRRQRTCPSRTEDLRLGHRASCRCSSRPPNTW
jgi:DNA topoisomerase III